MGLIGSAIANYDHSGDNLTLVKTRTVGGVPGEPQHAFTISIPDKQEDFDFSEEARKKDSRIFEVLDKDGKATGKYGFIFSAGAGSISLFPPAFHADELKNRDKGAEGTRETDLQHFNNGTTNGNWTIEVPKGVNDTQFIRKLLEADSNYARHLPPPYILPNPTGGKYNRGNILGLSDILEGGKGYLSIFGRNSNGYQNGLLLSAGAVPPSGLADNSFIQGGEEYPLPLWNNPVSNRFFEPANYGYFGFLRHLNIKSLGALFYPQY